MFTKRELISLYKENLLCLSNNKNLSDEEKQVNDNVIDAFLRLLERRSFEKVELPNIWCGDYIFFNKLKSIIQAEESNLKKESLEKLWSQTKKFNWFSLDFVMFPILLVLDSEKQSNHWTLIVVDMKYRHIVNYDPLGLDWSTESQIIERFFIYLESKDQTIQQEIVDLETWRICDAPTDLKLQKDVISCGAFVCAYADFISRRCDLGDIPTDHEEIRKNLNQSLVDEYKDKLITSSYHVSHTPRGEKEEELIIEVSDEELTTCISPVLSQTDPITSNLQILNQHQTPTPGTSTSNQPPPTLTTSTRPRLPKPPRRRGKFNKIRLVDEMGNVYQMRTTKYKKLSKLIDTNNQVNTICLLILNLLYL